MKKTEAQDLRKVLNPSQWLAVTTIEGPVLVVAGAGTGKTRVIEYRCLYMIEHGIPPEEILLLTFTKKAAREMLGRASLHNATCRKIEGGTFHSFAYRLIRKYKKALGLGENISFIDESDSADILHLLAQKAGYLEDKTRFPKKDTLQNILSMSMNRHQSIRDCLTRDYPHFLPHAGRLEDLRKRYAQYKLEHNLIDYDDMLLYLKFLLEDAQINAKVAARFRYIMVDEFQDTNKIQADIVFLLAQGHHNCLCVGDDTQSIYSFRGAYYRNMFDFPKRFPDTRVIKLEYNYRSTQPILDVANAIIEGEIMKYSKVLFTTRAGEEKPTLSYFKDSFQEAEWVASKVKEYRDQGAALSSIGILYRSNFLSLPLQLALSKLNIPFAVYGGIKFIETAHIKDVLAFLKVQHNPADELSLSRVLTLIEGIGPKTAEKIRGLISSGEEEFKKDLKIFIRSEQMQKEVSGLRALVLSLGRSADVGQKVKKILHFYAPYMKKKFDDYPLRQEDLKSFLEIASSYDSVEQFLADFVTIEPPQRSVADIEGVREDERPVVLSTIHSAKGLEWDVVFIIALVEGSLPVSYALDDEEAIEEERRLTYVAVTRARNHLHLSMHNEGRNGGVSTFNRLSRFLSEPKVLDKLNTEFVWNEEEGFALDEEIAAPRSKEGLYRKLADYFEDSDAENYL